MAHECEAERALAGAVGAHERVNLAPTDLEINAAKDLLIPHAHVEARDDDPVLVALLRLAHAVFYPSGGGRRSAAVN